MRETLSLNLVILISAQQTKALESLDAVYHRLDKLGCGPQDPIESLRVWFRDRLDENQTMSYDNVKIIETRIAESFIVVKDFCKRSTILQSLQYERMGLRYNSIVEAHEKTFEWIFEPHRWPQSAPRSRIHFRHWLVEENGIYWISGKPGSGKSTLMKYLSRCISTKACLQTWAGASRLCTASFYFWISGTEMQRTQQDLLQQLLFEVLRGCPDLIPAMCPTRWGDTSNTSNDQPWSHQELLETLGNLKDCNTSSTNFCFFIDGLDEYYGDHLELIELVQRLACIPYVKLCVSSRTWPCFEDAFGRNVQRKLYLQDLTRTDMTKFANDKLAEHPRSSCLTENKTEFQELVTYIAYRAEGVFLWTRLVVQSLRNGITNGDSPRDLRQRLQELPFDLEEFFERNIKSVDKVYERRMAVTFKLMLMARKPLPLLACSYIGEEVVSISDEHILRYKSTSWAEKNNIMHLAEIEAERHINGRFKGLLEAQSTGIVGHTEVNSLHRTVRDFLETRDMYDLLAKQLDSSFSVPIFACTAFVCLGEKHPGSIMEADVDEFMYFAHMVEIECQVDPDNRTKRRSLSHIVQEMAYAYHLEFQPAYISPKTVVGKALILEITTFIRYKILQDPLFVFMSKGDSLSLVASCIFEWIKSGDDGTIPTRSMELLLQSGANPNQSFWAGTLFRSFVALYHDAVKRDETWRIWIGLLPLFSMQEQTWTHCSPI